MNIEKEIIKMLNENKADRIVIGVERIKGTIQAGFSKWNNLKGVLKFFNNNRNTSKSNNVFKMRAEKFQCLSALINGKRVEVRYYKDSFFSYPNGIGVDTSDEKKYLINIEVLN